MRKCEEPGHVRIVYSTGKSDCHNCKLIRQRERESRPGYRAEKYAREKARPGFKERKATQRRLRKYGTDLPADTPCGICEEKMATDVDHDHETGVVRGFLCRHCNVWLAALEDKTFVERASYYLETSRLTV